MDFVNDYASDEDDSELKPEILRTEINMNTNPVVSASMLSTVLVDRGDVNNSVVLSGDNMALTNPKIEIMCAPAVGPAHPYKLSNSISTAAHKRVGMGYIEDTVIETGAFDDQFNSYLKSGYAVDSASGHILGNYDEYLHDNQPPIKRPKVEKMSKVERLMKKLDEDELNEEDNGIWTSAPVIKPLIPTKVVDTADKEHSDEVTASSEKEASEAHSNVHIVEPDAEEEKWEKVNERKYTFNTVPPRQKRGTSIADATTTFMGSQRDAQSARSWIAPPLGIKPEDTVLYPESHDCFIPKKCIKKFTGHTKGVQAIELFPKTGHLVLSASMDGTCKMWGLYDDDNWTSGSGRSLRRTYSGHSEGVRSIDFNNDGTAFLSSSFDRVMRLWDVETGVATGTFCNRKMGYQAKLNPNDNNLFLMAASDNKVYQWDIRSGSIVLEYNYHLKPCNTVTFFDEGRKFITTSDDKKMLVWEFDTPVPLKYITDDDMN